MRRLAFALVLLVLATAQAVRAQSAPVQIQLSSEIAPPGGMAQIKAHAYSPQPISTAWASLDVGSFSIDGIALFSSTGDVVGAAVVNGGLLNLQIFSPNGTFGSFGSYPLLTVAASIPSTAIPGQHLAIAPAPGSWSVNVRGVPTPVQLLPGSITVGGSISITNVVPGGGYLPAGASFTIFGVGFSPSTRVQLTGVTASSITYVSPTQIRVTLQNAAALDGALIQVFNPDNSSDNYYSYMRGVPVGQSSNTLVAHTVPVFSISTSTQGTLPPTISPLVNTAYFTAVAFQNPSQASATITVQSVSPTKQVTGSAKIVLAPGTRISREVSELLGSVLPTGAYLHVLSTQPVQMLGLLGNQQTGVVLPVAFALVPTTFTDIQVVGLALNNGPAVGSADTLTWQIKDNLGTANAQGVVFTSTLPASFQLHSAVPSQGTCSVVGQAITCSLGTINGGATATVAVGFTPTLAGTFATTGSATFTGSDTNSANNSFTVAISPK
jgi:hypothetical protein